MLSFITISSTNCKLTRLTQCGVSPIVVPGLTVKQKVSLPAHQCTIIQVSSGQFFVNEDLALLLQKNVFSSVLLRECFKQDLRKSRDIDYCRGIIYPNCFPVELKIDQTSFEDQCVLYSIDTFLDQQSFFKTHIDHAYNFYGHQTKTEWKYEGYGKREFPTEKLVSSNLAWGVRSKVLSQFKPFWTLVNTEITETTRFSLKILFSLKRRMTTFIFRQTFCLKVGSI